MADVRYSDYTLMWIAHRSEIRFKHMSDFAVNHSFGFAVV
jgi:hypothetical protein